LKTYVGLTKPAILIRSSPVAAAAAAQNPVFREKKGTKQCLPW
jgi:hypothetical protein